MSYSKISKFHRKLPEVLWKLCVSRNFRTTKLGAVYAVPVEKTKNKTNFTHPTTYTVVTKGVYIVS